MLCRHCAKQIADDSTYCLYCGTKVALTPREPQPYSSSAAMPWDTPAPMGAAPLPWSTSDPTVVAAPSAMPASTPGQISPAPSSTPQPSSKQGAAHEPSPPPAEAPVDSLSDSSAKQTDITNTKLVMRARAANSLPMDERVYAYPDAPYIQDSYSKVQSQKPYAACILPSLVLAVLTPLFFFWLLATQSPTQFSRISDQSPHYEGPNYGSNYTDNITPVTYTSSGVPPSEADRAAILGIWQTTGGDDTCCGTVGSLHVGETLEVTDRSLKYGEVFGNYAYALIYTWLDANHIQTSSGPSNGVYEVSVSENSLRLVEIGSMRYSYVFARSSLTPSPAEAPPTEVPPTDTVLPGDLPPTDTPLPVDTPQALATP